MFTRQELESEQQVESFKFSLDKITDENINAAFEVFTKDEIVRKLLADDLWFKLSDSNSWRVNILLSPLC